MSLTSTHETTDRWSHLPADARRDIDVYEQQLHRMFEGKVPEGVFLELRLRYGVYGQRQDGVQMIRIKIPLGLLTLDQCVVLADLSEEYADGISHVTTRQDIQYHNVDIRDTPVLMRRLADAGITTREACGNAVRNVTACPLTGVCRTQAFDVTPYARATTYFLLRHPDTQDFGRKFKIAFSGCTDNPCGLAGIHDIGAIARVKDGVNGFELVVGGGLGPVPHYAKRLYDFLPAEKLLPVCQAISRVFARHGQRKVRSKARFKFVVEKFGIDETRRLIEEELPKLPDDPEWTASLDRWMGRQLEEALKPGSALDLADRGPAFARWFRTNVQAQQQAGYSTVHVFLPLGDITADQLRAFVGVARKYVKEGVRLTVEQNMVLRYVTNADLPALHADLAALGLATPGAETIADVTACPGTDSCKLGIASSRGLAATLHEDLVRTGEEFDDVKDLRVKISGCPNSCGQHHIANIGFFGSSRRVGDHVAPVFQLILGGTSLHNAETYGMAMGKVGSHRAPEVVKRLASTYRAERAEGESFTGFVNRIGKIRVKDLLADLVEIEPYDVRPEHYTDLRQPREYAVKVGVGECAGGLVPQAEFMLDDADRQTWEATLHLEGGRGEEAAKAALGAMRTAGQALLTTRGYLISDRYDLVLEMQKQFVDSREFFAAHFDYLVTMEQEDPATWIGDTLRKRVEWATLFVEEAHVVHSRIAA